MSDFEKINLVNHAVKKLYNGTLSVDNFKVIIDECSKSQFEIITQKIKEIGKTAIEELKLRAQREEENTLLYNIFCEFDNEIIEDLD